MTSGENPADILIRSGSLKENEKTMQKSKKIEMQNNFEGPSRNDVRQEVGGGVQALNFGRRRHFRTVSKGDRVQADPMMKIKTHLEILGQPVKLVENLLHAVAKKKVEFRGKQSQMQRSNINTEK